ncbi:hypothetical protein BJ165DRAFT_1436534 [Panaeolus papilionaceus]|nr:hypothetical protein BJ165DRAFT_1436534 [Panaeolus papilionaceus]
MLISTANLPPALLDLTLSRLTVSATPVVAKRLLKWQNGALRRAHGLATEQAPHPGPVQRLTHHTSEEPNRQPRFRGALAVRGGGMQQSQKQGVSPIEELERRVQALEETINVEGAAFEPALYSEEDLQSFYEDVLAVPSPEAEPKTEVQAERRIMEAKRQEDAILISQLRERLCDNEVPANVAYRHILLKASEIAAKVEGAKKLGGGSTSSLVVPVGVITPREVEALLRTATHQHDLPASVMVLDIIESFSLPYPDDAVTSVLKVCAESGTGELANSIMANHAGDSTTEMQRHYHIQAHLRDEAWKPLPETALSLLHHYEDKGTPAPMKTYTSAITSLFSRPLSTSRAHAWDLFGHMRYAAHPDPDTLLYTLMIRACANPVSTKYPSEPERALDLWTEMTVDHKLAPTTGSYNAIILACAKSGTKMYVNEAFRLARQMLDAHRDARGNSPYRPDRDTFRALLEGTKRIGDLGRARWILAELVKLTNQAFQNEASHGGRAETLIDADIMTHVFHAYAAYKPPFTRSATVVVDGNKTENAQASSSSQETSQATDVAAAEQSSNPSLDLSQESTQSPSFAHLPPQSREEVIREAEFLFNGCMQGQEWAPQTLASDSPLMNGVLRDVRPTPSLFGAYMSVLFKHASLERAREAFWTWHQYWADPPAGLQKGTPAEIARNYVEALERCGNAKRGNERSVALEFSDELWQKWDQIEHSSSVKPHARLIERAQIARIRTLAITDEIDGALAQLRRFAAEYPASALRQPAPKHPSRSSRVSLAAARPLVRFIPPSEVPDDHVPPLVTFRDMEVLHHRLIDEERPQDIKYLTWLCKSYEWALRGRRDAAMKQKPVASS